MIKRLDKKSRLLIEVIIFSLFISIVTTSWAYFTFASVTQGKQNVVTAGSMEITFEDGNKVSKEDMMPGDSISKTFKVKNTGSIDTSYDVYFSETINTFVDKDDLVYTLISDSGCSKTSETVVPFESGERLVNQCSISVGATHSYTLKITFKETNDNQNDNQGREFTTKLSVNEFKTSDGYAIANAYVDAANSYYAANSTSSLLGKNMASTLNVEGKSSNDKVVVTTDGKIELAVQRGNQCYRKYALSDEINVIDGELCNANIENFVSNAGQLHVSGTKLLNERGEEVRLNGVGGGDWGTTKWHKVRTVNATSLGALKSWGGNVYRAFADFRKSWTTSYIGNEDKYIQIASDLVEAAKANDMYVIFNWDVWGDVDPDANEPQTAYAVDFFTRIATLYPNDPHVLYELWNEPTTATTRAVYLNHMNTVATAIRNISPDALLFTSFIGDSESLKDNLLPFDNIMYVVHNYMDTFNEDVKDRMQALLDQNIPIFITEWGGMGQGDEYRYDGIVDHLANEYYKFLNKNNLSYCYFAFGAVEGDSSLQYGIVPKGQWQDELPYSILTANGRFLRSILSNNYVGHTNVLGRNIIDTTNKVGSTYNSADYKDSIQTIKIVNYLNVPDNATAQWDLSFNKDGSIIGYIMPSSTTSGMYDLTIGANGDIYAPQNMQGLFAYMKNLTSIDFGDFIVSDVTNLNYTFAYDNKLNNLDLKSWDVAKLWQMNSTFVVNSSLTNLDISTWEPKNLEYMYNTFNSCSKLTELDLSKFDMTKVKNLSTMFTSMGSLKRVDISTWNPTTVSNISSLFKEARSLEYVDMRNLNITSTTNITDAMIRVKEGATIVVKSQEVADLLQSVSTNQLNFQIGE